MMRSERPAKQQSLPFGKIRKTIMTRSWLLSGMAGASMLGLAATAAFAGFSGQGLDALEAAAPASSVEKVHLTKHSSCKAHVIPPRSCHRHRKIGGHWVSRGCSIFVCRPALYKKTPDKKK